MARQGEILIGADSIRQVPTRGDRLATGGREATHLRTGARCSCSPLPAKLGVGTPMDSDVFHDLRHFLRRRLFGGTRGAVRLGSPHWWGAVRFARGRSACLGLTVFEGLCSLRRPLAKASAAELQDYLLITWMVAAQHRGGDGVAVRIDIEDFATNAVGERRSAVRRVCSVVLLVLADLHIFVALRDGESVFEVSADAMKFVAPRVRQSVRATNWIEAVGGVVHFEGSRSSWERRAL